MKTVIFYTTSGCHLCEQALVLLNQVQQVKDIQIETVDIADSDHLIERYGIRIPVIRLEDAECELGWPFSIDALEVFLSDRDPTPDFTARP